MLTANSCLSAEDLALIQRAVKTSPDASDLSKAFLLWLLDLTLNFSRPVCVSFPPVIQNIGEEVVNGFHDMISSGGGMTHLDDVFRATGTDFKISFCCGFYLAVKNGGRYSGGHTAWISDRDYDDHAMRFVFNLDSSEDINVLTKRIRRYDFSPFKPL